MRKHERELKKLAGTFGYRVVRRKSHLALVRDGYPTIWCSLSPSDQRAMRNVRKNLKHAVEGII
jgi:hypothetical protein